MNNSLKWLIITSISLSNLWACDVCGCRVGGGLAGPELENDFHFIGITYNYTQYKSHVDWSKENLDAGGDYLADEYSKDNYNLVNLSINLALNEFFRIDFQQPIKYNHVVSSDQNESLYGLGDSRASIQWQPIFPKTGFKEVWSHYLGLSLGIETPTAQRSTQNSSNKDFNENFHLGSGSWDFFTDLKYTIRNGQWGWHSELSYQWNTENNLGYQRGNQKTLRSSLIYYDRWRNYSYNLIFGAGYNESESDKVFDFVKANRGGSSYTMNTSTQWRWDNYTTLVGVEVPLKQEFYTEDNATLSGGVLVQVSIGYYF